MPKLFESSQEMVEATAKRNVSLQGAYVIMAASVSFFAAARSRGLTIARRATIKPNVAADDRSMVAALAFG